MQLSSSAVLPSLEELERRLTTSRRILMNRMICLGVSISSSSSTAAAAADDVGRSGCRVLAESHDDDDDDSDDDAKLVISGGLSTVLLSLLEVAFESWSKPHEDRDSHDHAILLRTLTLLSGASRLDPTLGEEIAKGRGRGGTSVATVCSRVLERIDECVADNGRGGGEIFASSLVEDDADAFADLQDAVFEIYSPSSSSSSSSSSLPASCMPLTDDELRSRLPLLYHLTPAHRRRHREDGEEGRERDQREPSWRHRTRRRKRVGGDATTVFISQVTRRQSAQADVGFVMWPSAIVLSRYLVSNPHRLVVPPREGGGVGWSTSSPSVILELGAGCGLVGITAARVILASRREMVDDDDDEEEEEVRRGETLPVVVITDVNEIVLDNIARNVELNDVSSIAYASRLDFYAHSGDCRTGRWVPGGTMGAGEGGGSADGGGGGASEGRGLGPADVVLAADIICRPEDAIAASRTIYDALRPGGVALVVCANAEHRFGVEIFECECEKRGLAVTSTDVAEMYDGGLLEGDLMETAAGYVDGMRMTFFEITKIR